MANGSGIPGPYLRHRCKLCCLIAFSWPSVDRPIKSAWHPGHQRLPSSCLADLFDLDTPRHPSSQRIRPLLNRQCSRRKARQDARLFPYRLAHLQDRRDPLRRCKCYQSLPELWTTTVSILQRTDGTDSMH